MAVGDPLIGEFNIDFSKRDFISIVEQADALLEVLVPEWTTRDDNDINWAAVKACAFLVSIGHFYIDLGINERDPFEVQIRRNALNIARQYGFPVRQAVGGITRVSFNITPQGSPFTVARGESCQTDDGLSYVVKDDVDFPISSGSEDANLQFGVFERFSLGTSDASDFQNFVVDRDRVQDKAVRLFIDEGSGFVEWELRNTLLQSIETDEHARLVLNEDEQYEIFFGDNLSGKVPANLADIEVEVITLPIDAVDNNFGNLPAGNLTSCSVTEVTSITETTDITGGGVGQTVEEIGRSLPQWISTADRAVAREDYVFLARQVGGVKDAQALQTGINVDVFIIPVGGGLATPALQAEVLAFLLVRIIPIINLSILIPTQVANNISVTIVVNKDKRQSVIADRVKTALENFLDKPDEVGKALPLMAAYDLVNDTDGVDRGTITAMHKASEGITVGDILLSLSEVSVLGTVTITPSGGLP